MTIKDFMAVCSGDFDVYDNYTEELGIAYCGERLTPEGERHFEEVLQMPVVEITNDTVTIGVDIKGLPEAKVEKRLRLAKDLFESIAGYCSADDYDIWVEQD